MRAPNGSLLALSLALAEGKNEEETRTVLRDVVYRRRIAPKDPMTLSVPVRSPPLLARKPSKSH